MLGNVKILMERWLCCHSFKVWQVDNIIKDSIRERWRVLDKEHNNTMSTAHCSVKL